MGEIGGRIWRWARRITSALLGVLAAIFILVGILFGFESFDTSQAIREQGVLREFHRVESIVLAFQVRNGRLPSKDELISATANAKFEWIGNELIWIDTTPVHYCEFKDYPFEPEPKDKFVLGVWRGEFMSCYASPSGKTTLETSRWYWLKFGLRTGGPVSLGAFLLSFLTFFAAYRLFPRRPKSMRAQAASSS